MPNKRLKYQEKINQLSEKGVSLPLLKMPNNITSFRFVFAEDIAKSQIPQYLRNPALFLTDSEKNKLKTTGYALSCFSSEENARNIFSKLQKSSKNVHKRIGESVASCNLSNNDGEITEANTDGHFDLYEYESCNLTPKMVVIGIL